MRSVVARFSEEFARLRVGIAPVDAEGRMIEPADATEFVLEEFQRSERLVIEGAIERAADAVERTVTDDLTTAMNQFNAIGG